MSDSDTQKELEEIKRQMAALTEARREKREPPQPEATETPDPGAASEEGGLSAQIEELVGLMEHELRDNPMVTGAAIFVAGLLVGRMLR